MGYFKRGESFVLVTGVILSLMVSVNATSSEQDDFLRQVLEQFQPYGIASNISSIQDMLAQQAALHSQNGAIQSVSAKSAPPFCTPATLLTEDFEGAGELPAGWTNAVDGVDDDNNAWGDSLIPAPSHVSMGGTNSAHSGSKWLVFDTSLIANGSGGDSIVYFPVDLSSAAIPVGMSFFLYMWSDGETPSTFEVDVMRDVNGNGLPDDGSWENEFTENTDQQSSAIEAWKNVAFDLNDYSGDKVIVRFRGRENTGATFKSDIEIDLLTISTCPGNTISGTFSLPPGVVAPAGGIDLLMLASMAENGTRETVGVGIDFPTIPAGSNSVGYSLAVPNTPGKFTSVIYQCGSQSCLETVPGFFGAYRPSDMVFNPNEAFPLASGQNHNNIDFAIPAGRTISGTVSLPPGDTAPMPLEVFIQAFDSNTGLFGFAFNLMIPMGGSSVNYSVLVPNSASAMYSVLFACNDCADIDNYLPFGLYRAAGTTFKLGAADTVAGGQNHNSIDMTVLRGKQITGTLSLPGAQLAPANINGNIEITPQFGRDFFGGFADADIAMGANSSMMYTAVVPDDPGQTWIARYSCSSSCEDNGFLGEGYYATGGTTYRQDLAGGIPGGQNQNGIDLTLLPAKTVTGMVSLPPGHTANEDLFVNVRITDDRSSPSPWPGPDIFSPYRDSDSDAIPLGGSNMMYERAIPDDPAFRGIVRFNCSGRVCTDWVNTYAKFGFYRSGGTTYEIEKSTRLSGGQDHNNINMTLFNGRTISGKLTLPGPAGMGFEDGSVADFNHTESTNTGVGIFEGLTMGPYSFVVPDDPTLDFAVGIDCEDVFPRKTCNGHARRAFYSDGSKAVVSLESDATLLPGGQNHSNIDLSYPAKTFDDIPQNFPFYNDIESLFQIGVTGGCSTNPPNYCPKDRVTRAQMAVFLERFMRPDESLPAPTGTKFNDVALTTFGVREIENFSADGITSGCSANPPLYCPGAFITRAQMAVFLLRALNGAQFTPPPAQGIFADVPTNAFAADWIEELARTGITGGCGNNNFCPNNSVTREQMAAFINRLNDQINGNGIGFGVL